MFKNKVTNVRIAIIVVSEAEDMEVVVPYDLWKRAGLIVDTISVEKKNTLYLQSGIKISCNESLESTNIDKYNAIYLPGGRGYSKLLDEKTGRLAKKLLKFANDKKKYLFAASTGSIVLIKNNVVTDQKLTVYPGYEDQLEKYFQAGEIVVSRNFITTQGVCNIFLFSLVVIKTLVNKQIAQSIAEDILFKYDDL